MTEPERPLRLLLINPRFPESFWSFRWVLTRILPGKRALNPPLGLATLAALCPPNWQVEIVDENIEPVPSEPRADVIGVCGMAVQFIRQQELLRSYRERGYYVVAGGSYASLCPERYADLADTVIAGEAEYVWPRFCREFTDGCAKALYHEQGAVDLADSPPPRFDLLKMERYVTASLQFSRGCPYRCELCDIIVMFGRRPRTKDPAQVGRELEELRRLGVRSVFFVDDNLIGNRPKAKVLLRYLADYQRRHGYAFEFGTEASLNLAEDGELMGLFREAGFAWVFIGIESPDEASLAEARKTQNMRLDILTAVRRIYSYGIDVLAGFIVGFDNDGPGTFERQYRFIQEAGIQVAMVGLLNALPKTPLHERLAREGRLIEGVDASDNTKPGTNFIPKGMSYEALVAGYKQLYRRLASDRAIAERIVNKMRYLRRPVPQTRHRWSQRLGMLARFLVVGVLPGGALRLWHFARSLAGAAMPVWPLLISDWIAALSMRSYVHRYFGLDPEREQRLLQNTLAFARRVCARSVRLGDLQLATGATQTVMRLKITLRGRIDPRFYTGVARRLERLLRRSAAMVSLKIERISEQQLRAIDQLLHRLARYGDRIVLHLHPHIRPLLTVDLSLFRTEGASAGG